MTDDIDCNHSLRGSPYVVAMARTSRRMKALALLAVTLSAANAQLSDLPDLSTATQTTATTPSSASSTAATSATTTGASFAATTTSSNTVFHLTGLPTIEGAGIPTLEVPYTADAPFMQKSNLPEGTFFIAVGATLAFLGACVLLWRAMVAWSVNRSVKRAAMASIRGSEKTSTWGGSSFPPRGSMYKEISGSNMSLDALTPAGKPVGKSHFRDHEIKREATPPAGLFFSPTAQAGSGAHNGNRTSSYLPAGYYASPSAQAAGGAGSTTIGGSLAPYTRSSFVQPSPPPSPGLAPTTRNTTPTFRASSRDGLRAPSRDGLLGSSRPGSYLDTGRQGQSSGLYAQPSSSSLMVGVGGRPSRDSLAGSRAPSAYLEDLFENHGNGPRERY